MYLWTLLALYPIAHSLLPQDLSSYGRAEQTPLALPAKIKLSVDELSLSTVSGANSTITPRTSGSYIHFGVGADFHVGIAAGAAASVRDPLGGLASAVLGMDMAVDDQDQAGGEGRYFGFQKVEDFEAMVGRETESPEAWLQYAHFVRTHKAENIVDGVSVSSTVHTLNVLSRGIESFPTSASLWLAFLQLFVSVYGFDHTLPLFEQSLHYAPSAAAWELLLASAPVEARLPLVSRYLALLPSKAYQLSQAKVLELLLAAVRLELLRGCESCAAMRLASTLAPTLDLAQLGLVLPACGCPAQSCPCYSLAGCDCRADSRDFPLLGELLSPQGTALVYLSLVSVLEFGVLPGTLHDPADASSATIVNSKLVVLPWDAATRGKLSSDPKSGLALLRHAMERFPDESPIFLQNACELAKSSVKSPELSALLTDLGALVSSQHPASASAAQSIAAIAEFFEGEAAARAALCRAASGHALVPFELAYTAARFELGFGSIGAAVSWLCRAAVVLDALNTELVSADGSARQRKEADRLSSDADAMTATPMETSANQPFSLETAIPESSPRQVGMAVAAYRHILGAEDLMGNSTTTTSSSSSMVDTTPDPVDGPTQDPFAWLCLALLLDLTVTQASADEPCTVFEAAISRLSDSADRFRVWHEYLSLLKSRMVQSSLAPSAFLQVCQQCTSSLVRDGGLANNPRPLNDVVSFILSATPAAQHGQVYEMALLLAPRNVLLVLR
jgi:hypothetical protein